jgi:hypothetical protein
VESYLLALPGCPSAQRGAVRDFAADCLAQLQTSPEMTNAPQLATSGNIEFVRHSIGRLLELAAPKARRSAGWPREAAQLMLWANLLQPTRPQLALDAYHKARKVALNRGCLNFPGSCLS